MTSTAVAPGRTGDVDCDRGVTFRVAGPGDRAGVCATITAAFIDAESPEMSYFFADRFAELAPIFAGNLFDKRVRRSTVWVADDCSVAALWDAPEHALVGRPAAGVPCAAPDEMAPAPAAPPPTPLPPAVQARLDAYDDVVRGLLPQQPHWYLGILARHPSRRGLGLARRLTRLVLDRCGGDKDDGAGGPTLPAVLETTNPLNVAAYERAGWTLHATSDALQPAMRIYVMRHDRGGRQEFK